MTDLMELASRVEAGEGQLPDHDLDAEIALAVSYAWCRRATGASNHRHPIENQYGHGFSPPSYSASLDAAMTLVPEGYGFQVDGYKAEWWASLSAEYGFNATARTPALALTAAALRARANQGTAHAEQ